MTRAGSPPPPEDSDSDLPSGSRPELRSLFHTRHAGLRAELGALQRAVDLPTTVLIFGESGTGKDRLARALHDASARAPLSFVRIDAANLSDDLFESELFGHERGAFTGAVAVKRGLLEVAGEGTAYLDEVSSLSPAAQAKFLRVLQERTFRRLGGTATHAFRARLIVSSRRDLAELVARGAFRDDFFYRIDVVSVRLRSRSVRRTSCRSHASSSARRRGSTARRPGDSRRKRRRRCDAIRGRATCASWPTRSSAP
jgi:transcriptional regulator with PAS, ATPase and Fis domain